MPILGQAPRNIEPVPINQDKRNENTNMENKKTALIIGAGPAGLTAAYELLKRTDYKPIIFEMVKRSRHG